MHTAPHIREATPEDLDLLVDTLSDAFHDDPVMNWVIPERSLYADFFRIIIRDLYFPKGIIHLDDKGRGAALWLPPGVAFEIPPRLGILSLVACLVLKRGFGTLIRMWDQGALFDTHHPTSPHYYLQFIGCRRDAQGMGVGSSLLKQGTRLVDAEGMPAYLESSNELNVPLYQRHRFEVTTQDGVSGDGPQVWFMWREASQPDS